MSSKTSASKIDAAKLAKNTFVDADGLKTKAITAKRAATALRSVISDLGQELGIEERQSLEQAFTTLGKVAAAYDHAQEIRRRADDALARRVQESTAIIQRIFGPYNSVADKVAMIASTSSWVLDAKCLAELHEDSQGRKARRLIGATFQEALQDAAYRVATQDDDMETFAAAALANFEASRERLHIKYAAFVVAINQAVGEPS